MNFVTDMTWSYWVAVKHFIFLSDPTKREKSSFNVISLSKQNDWNIARGIPISCVTQAIGHSEVAFTYCGKLNRGANKAVAIYIARYELIINTRDRISTLVDHEINPLSATQVAYPRKWVS